MDEEVEGAAVRGVLNLTDILELIVDRLDQSPLAEQEFVCQGEQPVLHVLAELRDQMEALLDEEGFGEGLRAVALVPEQFAKEAADQAGNRTPIIEVARAQAKGQPLATIIDEEMEFESVDPPPTSCRVWRRRERRDAAGYARDGRRRVRWRR